MKRRNKECTWILVFPVLLMSLTLLLSVKVLAFETDQTEKGSECFAPPERVGVLQDGDLFPTAEIDNPKKMYMLSTDSQTWNAALDALYDGLLDRNENINISQYKIPKTDFLKLWNQVFYGHEDLFFVDWVRQYWSTTDAQTGEKYLTTIEIDYKDQYKDSDLTEFYAKAQEIVDAMPDGLDPQQKTLYLHDYIVTHCEYDLATLELDEDHQDEGKYNAYNVIVEGSAVCQGYSLAYAYLCKKVGVNCYLVTSSYNNHAWNLVELDGRYYFVDCTSDDPANHWYEARCLHLNYLRSRDGFAKQGNLHSITNNDWTSIYLDNVTNFGVDSTKYESYYWSDVNCAMPFIGTLQAYALSSDTENVYLRTNYGTVKKVPIGANAIWRVWGQNSYWTGMYTGMVAIGDEFYFNTQDTIYRLTTDGTVEAFYELTDAEKKTGYLYGIVDEGNQIAYNIGTVAWDNTKFERKLKEVPNPEINIEFLHNCSFGNNLSFYFAAPASALEGYENIRLVCTRKQADKTGDTFTDVETTLTNYRSTKINGENYYMFEYSNIAAKNMGDEITAVLYGDKDGKTYASKKDVNGVGIYAYDRLENSNNAKFKTLIVEMLNYGAKAQIYFNYNTKHLVNAALTEDQKKLGTSTLPELTAVDESTGMSGAEALISKKNVGFSTNIILTFAVAFPDNYDMSGVQLEISYTAADGKTKNSTIPGASMGSATIENVKMRTGSISTISAKDLGAVVTAQVTKNGTVISNVQKYSVESYAKNRLEESDDENFKALVSALMMYGKSAEAYFAKTNE